MHSIAIFGGTFDPIHYGHINTSINLQNSFAFDSYYFIPCKIPALKLDSTATKEQRITMLQLVLNSYPQFNLDLREMLRDTPSYMVDTLTSFRRDYQNASITLILGYDTFISLPKWHQWEKIIKLANLLVINRDSFGKITSPEPLKQLIKIHATTKKEDLLTHEFGYIMEFNAGNYPISSTEIRARLKGNVDVRSELPGELHDYIKQQGLYQ